MVDNDNTGNNGDDRSSPGTEKPIESTSCLDSLSTTPMSDLESPPYRNLAAPVQIHPILLTPFKECPSQPLFSTEQLGVDRRLIVNRKRQLKMYRVWMQGKFRKKD